MSEIPTSEAVRQEEFDDRWTSFGTHTGILKIYKHLSAERLKEFEIFQDYELDFLEKIRPDVCVAIWDKQKVLFEEGAYIDLAFFVLKGQVNVYIQKQQIGNSHKRANGKGRAQFDDKSRVHFNRTVYNTQVQRQQRSGRVTLLSSMDLDLNWGEVINLGPGEILGETGASVGWPQSVTAQTATQCALVQVRIPALEAMKRKSPALKKRLNKLYIERSLSAQLKHTPIFQGCSEAFLEQFKQKVELISLRRNEVVARQDEPADTVYLVRSGFIKLSQKVGSGEMVVNYLSKGMLLGEIEFALQTGVWFHSAISVENTELVRISHEHFKELVERFPAIHKQLMDSSSIRIKESGAARRNINRSEFINTALETGLVEGNSVFVINLDVCTRCDDCVKGCADTHAGLPRFVREGEKYSDYLITRACYHCRDPVCLIGCPTGAIRRAGVGDVVEIDDGLCIGCRVCYHKCPYSAITMVQSPSKVSVAVVAPIESSGELATKCDLCYNTPHGAACVFNCPQGCAIRTDSISKFGKLVTRSGRRAKVWGSTKLGKLIKSQPWLHAFLLATLLACVIYVLNRIFSDVLPGNVWGLSYGAGALILMVGAALYGFRRRMVRLSAEYKLGRSFTWVQFHVYGGTLFLLLLFMHTGFQLPSGALYWWLWSLSIWVTLSGVMGVFLQKWIPSILSSGLSIEVISDRIPELVEEARKQAATLVETCSQPVADFYHRRVKRSLSRPLPSITYLFDITGGIQRKTKQFQFLRTILPEDDQTKLTELEKIYKSKLEMDAHHTLQRLLKWWMYAHLPASIVLIVLVLIHLFAVLYY